MQLRSRSGGATTRGRVDAADLEHFASPSMNPADYFYPPASTQAQRQALLGEVKQLNNAQEAKNWSYGLEVSNVPKHVPTSEIPTADTLDIEAECQKIVLGNEAKPGHSSDKSSETEEFRHKTRNTAAYKNQNFHLTFPTFQRQHHLHHAASTAAEDDIHDDEELLITGGDNFILSSIHHQYKETIGVDIMLHNNNNNPQQQQQAGDTDSASIGHHHPNQQPDTKATSQKRTHQDTIGIDTTSNKAIKTTTDLINDLLLPGGGLTTDITTNTNTTTATTTTPGTLMLNMDYEKAMETINYQLAANRGVPNQAAGGGGGLVMAPFDGDAISKCRRD